MTTEQDRNLQEILGFDPQTGQRTQQNRSPYQRYLEEAKAQANTNGVSHQQRETDKQIAQAQEAHKARLRKSYY